MKTKKLLLFFAILSLFAIPIFAGSISNCGSLSSPNTVYTLTQSVSSSGTCFNVTAPNVTLDCNGFYITGNNFDYTYGVYSNQFNTTVRNCNIADYNYDVYLASGSGYCTLTNINSTSKFEFNAGIYIDSSSYNTLTNINATSLNDFGIWLYQSSYNTLTNIKVNSYQNAIYLQTHSDYNTFTNIETTSVIGPGVEIAHSSNNLIMNANLVSTSDNGIEFDLESNDNTVTNINATVTCNSAFGNNYGAYLNTRCNYNTIANSTISSNCGIALVIQNSGSNTVYNNTLTSGSGSETLLFLQSDSGGNLFYWNNFTNTSGLYVNDKNGNNFYNTTISGQPAGNIWYNVINGSVSILGNRASPYSGLYYGSSGSGYPYSNATAEGKVSGNVVDYAPIAPAPSAPPTQNATPPAYNQTQPSTDSGILWIIGATVVILLAFILLVFIRRRK